MPESNLRHILYGVFVTRPWPALARLYKSSPQLLVRDGTQDGNGEVGEQRSSFVEL